MERSTGSGGSALLQQYIAPRAKFMDETRLSDPLDNNDDMDMTRKADREKTTAVNNYNNTSTLHRNRTDNLSKSDRLVNKTLADEVLANHGHGKGHVTDTFDFDTFVIPVSDPVALQQYKQLETMRAANSNQQASQKADTVPPMRERETKLPAPSPTSKVKSEHAKKMAEIINLSRKAIEADESGYLEDAYQLYKQSVDLSMNLMPSLDETKHEKLQLQITAFLDQMERLTKEMRDQSLLDNSSEDNSLNSENEPMRANMNESSHREWMKKSQESLEKLTSARTKDKDRTRSVDPGTANPKSNRSTTNMNSASNRHLSATNSKSKEELNHMREELEMLKERLQGFILGGDASGRRGQNNAFGLNNVITNLNASVFGEFKRLEPIPENRERYWNQQVQVLVYSTLESIVEKQPRSKTLSNGFVIEELVDVPREDIARILPTLHSADLEIRKMCSEFKELQTCVRYEKAGGSNNEEQGDSMLGENNLNKWWIEKPKVPKGGLSPALRDQVYGWRKRAAALQMECRNVNFDVLQSMPVPQYYLENLPIHVKEVLGEPLVRELMMPNNFSIERYLKSLNMWNEQHAGLMASKLEKAVMIWSIRIEAEKQNHGGGNGFEKASGGGGGFGLKKFFDKVKRSDATSTLQKMIAVNQKADHALRTLRDAFPFMPHTEIDTVKLQSNHDIGSAGLEAFSRALEARAAKIKDRLDDLIQADERARRANGSQHPRFPR